MESNCENDPGFATDNDDGGMGDMGDETEGELVPGFDGDEDTFEVVELEILARRRREWTQARKKEKPAVLGEICRELAYVLPLSCPFQEITTWLRKPLRTRKPRVTVRSRYKYSVCAVIRELYHDQIQQKHALMKQEDGSKADTKRIDLYQRALTAFMQDDLTEEQLQAARDIADKWNGAEGPTADVQARNAVRYGPQYIRNFAEEMWRYCGMRMVFMTGWKDEKGVVQACCMDYNSQIGGGTAFDDIYTLNPSWREYLGKSFEDADLAEEEEMTTKGKQTLRTKKCDPVKLVTNEQGEIWIGEVKGCSHDQLHQMIRGFLTAHYRKRGYIRFPFQIVELHPLGKACGRPSASVPFKKLGQYQQDMIAARHLPPNFTFTVDPSHLHSATAAELLNFWWERQVTHPHDVFAFQKRLDQSGNLQPPVDHNTLPLVIARSRKKRTRKSTSDDSDTEAEQATPGDNASHSRATTRIARKKPGQGKRRRIPMTDDEMDPDHRLSDDDQSQDLDTRENNSRGNDPHGTSTRPYPPRAKSSRHGRGKGVPMKEKHRTPYVADEDEGNTSSDQGDEDDCHNRELPAVSKPSASKQPMAHQHGERYTTQLRDASEGSDNGDFDSVPFTDEQVDVPQSSGRRGSRSALKPAIKSQNRRPDGQQGELRKSGRTPKSPARPDANVPSPTHKPSRKKGVVKPRVVKKCK
ncbi:hypothetical protein EDD15DRAFT_2197735 [Pisolithus albus]|nr:hypothetical protein EDD15DRAFT_2197735 [Pisolithus albus]